MDVQGSFEMVKSEITLKNYKEQVHLGCTAEEQSYPQIVEFDCHLTLDLSKCVVTDDLNDTVDHIKIAQVISNLAAECRWKLVEKLAADVAKELLAAFKQIQDVKISVRKKVSVTSECFSVNLVISRNA